MSCPTSLPPNSEDRERAFLHELGERRDQQPRLLLALQDLLLDFERRIALIERSLPLNFQEEVRDLEVELGKRAFRAPRFRYPASRVGVLVREVNELCASLCALRVPEPWQLVVQLLVKRADELSLEAQLVDALGKTARPELVALRYPIEREQWTLASDLANEWLMEGPERVADRDVDLAHFLRERARTDRIDLPVIERSIAAIAAVSADGLLVQTGARVIPREAERIWVHEVHAHFLPRQRGSHSFAPLAAGCEGAGSDEEGRALLLEKRCGLLSVARRQQLAVRHLVATTVRQDPIHLGERAVQLVERGAEPATVARAVCRSLRGGGLAREAVYLPALLQVERTFTDRPELELWMKWGRVSVAAAAQLENWLWSNSTTVGA